MNEHARSGKVTRVTVEEAQARIAELLRRAEAGERIRVTREGKPVVEFAGTLEGGKPKLPRIGAFEGQFELPDDWDEIPTGFEKHALSLRREARA